MPTVAEMERVRRDVAADVAMGEPWSYSDGYWVRRYGWAAPAISRMGVAQMMSGNGPYEWYVEGPGECVDGEAASLPLAMAAADGAARALGWKDDDFCGVHAHYAYWDAPNTCDCGRALEQGECEACGRVYIH